MSNTDSTRLARVIEGLVILLERIAPTSSLVKDACERARSEIKTYPSLQGSNGSMVRGAIDILERQTAQPNSPEWVESVSADLNEEFEKKFLESIKKRLLADPAIVAALDCARPELVLQITRRKLEWNDQTLKGRLALLIHEGFFKVPRGAGDVLREAQRRGWMTKDNRSNHVAIPLGSLTEEGFLVREADGYQVSPGIKISTKEV